MTKSATAVVSASAPVITPGSITIAPLTAAIVAGQSVTFTGKYLATDGITGIGGATLFVFSNGVQVTTTTTAADGSYSVGLSFPSAGTYNVDVADNAGNTG
jgi:hypothetical protein